MAATVLGACSSNQAQQTSATEINRGNWSCQPLPDSEGWNCVTDENVETSAPTRPVEKPPDAVISVAEPSTASVPPPAPSPIEPPTSPTPAVSPPAPKTAPPSQVSPEASRGVPADAPPPVTSGDLSDLPNYARLAYQPPEPMLLTEIPGEFYAVQLVAFSTREVLEAYARRRNLTGMSAARVARDGELFYVLLLGIYETRARAESAIADIPPPFENLKVWIRSVASLQAAIRAADALTSGDSGS
ncbi:MAG: SPOR domain-containing protein [Pseudomonadales bacterium]|nr:SPOR domain-containing protein [Pseudomonadales bacterium]MDP6470505.1 SPOR domain-containing protein [Pseudomonadales bacterium]MDP6827807.1 SPOR domain-containing protein [Pseudomonadales bacterium]MDP6972979.1 SPOR domain-containing protein [Pseudomonadales bacterium]